MSRKLLLFLVSICAAASLRAYDLGPEIVISVRDQKMALIEHGAVAGEFRISTSRFGIGDEFGSYKTPAGVLWVCNKIGDNLPEGAVIKNRNATGEVLAPNAPGRDPIVTRVIWLKGLSGDTQHAYDRCIYIHGTPEEKTLGRPMSWGCIRMRSKDVVEIYNAIGIGTHVTISEKKLASLIPEARAETHLATSD